MHVDFDPLKIEWAFDSQEGGGVGAGGTEYSIFRGIPYQRGAGIGSVLRSFMMRYLLPMGKQIGVAIGRQGLESGNKVLSNVLEGKDLKESLMEEGRTGLKNLLEKAARNVAAQKEKQKGEGGSFDFKRYQKGKRQKSIHRLRSSVGPPNFLPITGKKGSPKKKTKRLRVDALGTY